MIPALDRFRPDLVLVACGFDASAMDPLGRMMLTAAGFGELTRILLAAAARLCDGRVVYGIDTHVEDRCHEGGYSAELVPFCGLHTVEALAGVETAVRDTILQVFPEGFAGQDLQPHQETAIERAAALVVRIGAG